MDAHAKFDLLWKHGYMTRRQAYGWMRREMGLSAEEAHIGRFDQQQCADLIDKAEHALGLYEDARRDFNDWEGCEP